MSNMSGRGGALSDNSGLNSFDYWDYTIELECLQGPQDLQLAAELGKTLLERNKELETCLKQHQNIIEDQTQEIEYLTKQTAALREVNDSRLRIYEQLEVSIQDLERANQRLALDNSADKKHIKNLCLSIDSLEARCEELQRALDDMMMQADSERRRRKSHTIANPEGVSNGVPSSPIAIKGDAENKDSDNSLETKDNLEDDEITRLCAQLQELRSQRMKDQRKVSELGEQLATVLQENMSLEEQVTILKQREDDLKSLQEEISTLEEVRQGHLCGRCLRTVDSRGHDELSLMLDNEEEEDVSVVNSCISETHCSTVMLHIQEPVIDDSPRNDNPYRVLVEKYEALLEMQRHPASTRQQQEVPSNNCLSLQEELQMSGDFNSFSSKVDVESDQEQTEPHELQNKGRLRSKNGLQKAFSATPTDFSEAETSSSGFSDETSNKATQTDSNLPPGSFLCSIADGDDCRFSIYDDASPIESRFRKTPEYRQLFREIFAVLKRAAEAKDEGEKLPLLEDLTPISEAPRVPPVTPAKEELPQDFTRTDKAKVEKHSHSKSTVDRKLPSKENICHDKIVKNSSEPQSNSTSMKEEILEPLALKEVVPLKSKQGPKQDILEYLSVGVGIRKKSNGRKNSPVKKTTVAERVEHIESLPSSGNDGGTSYASRTCNHTPRRRREFRNSERYRMSETQERVGRESPSTWGDWFKKEVQTPESPKPSGTRQSSYQRQDEQGTWDFHPFVSSASQEVAKLKRLEKSYAEVLRLGPQKPPNRAKNGYRK